MPRGKIAAMIHNYPRYGKRERLSLFHSAELSDVPVRVHVRDPRLQHLLFIYLPLSEVPEIAPERFRIRRPRVAVKRQYISNVCYIYVEIYALMYVIMYAWLSHLADRASTG